MYMLRGKLNMGRIGRRSRELDWMEADRLGPNRLSKTKSKFVGKSNQVVVRGIYSYFSK